MANLGKTGDFCVARFRFLVQECKTSLKTSSLTDAKAAMHLVEQTIHRLTSGDDPGAIGVAPLAVILRVEPRREPARDE